VRQATEDNQGEATEDQGEAMEDQGEATEDQGDATDHQGEATEDQAIKYQVCQALQDKQLSHFNRLIRPPWP